jgi:hypothetical protein
MLRCASSFVVAAYAQVRLNPHDLRALPAELFTQPSNMDSFRTFYESVIFDRTEHRHAHHEQTVFSCFYNRPYHPVRFRMQHIAP